MDWHEQLTRDGYAMLRGVLPPREVAAALDSCTAALASGDASVLAGSGGPAYGARNLLRLWPDAMRLARALAEPLLLVLGPAGGVVRGLYFDKPPGHSWALPWHRDFNVAVKAHGPLGTFDKPTRKAGVPHVEAPAELLAAMVTARVHLDPMTPHNGPLRVVPGSHLTDAETGDAVTLLCEAGDVLLMRPLLLHASGHADPAHPAHRRIVHLECAPSPSLADGYEWHDFVPLSPLPPGG
jgi:hypothetical protein